VVSDLVIAAVFCLLPLSSIPSFLASSGDGGGGAWLIFPEDTEHTHQHVLFGSVSAEMGKIIIASDNGTYVVH
jgi:hypothetical protein